MEHSSIKKRKSKTDDSRKYHSKQRDSLKKANRLSSGLRSHDYKARRLSSGLRQTETDEEEDSGKSFWSTISPYFTSVFVYSALVWSVLITYVAQKMVILYDSYQTKDKQLTRRQSVLTHGKIFHGMVSFLMVSINPFWERKVKFKVPKEDLPKACIYMCNHTSFSDPFIISGVIPESKAVGQASVFNIPIAGEVFRNNGDMQVHFEKKPNGKWGTKEGSTKELMDLSRSYLDDGVSLAVFPEGTITKTGHLQPFKSGYFHLAVQTGVPIVPVSIWGAQVAWPMDLSKTDISTPAILLAPASVYVQVGEPIPSTGGITMEELKEKVWKQIDHQTRTSPNYGLQMYEK